MLLGRNLEGPHRRLGHRSERVESRRLFGGLGCLPEVLGGNVPVSGLGRKRQLQHLLGAEFDGVGIEGRAGELPESKGADDRGCEHGREMPQAVGVR